MKACCSQYLNEQFGGDADIAAEIYSEYVASVNEKLAEAKAQFSRLDWDQLDRTAHTIKGNALAVGDAETADTAIALRSAVKLCDDDTVKGLIDKLAELIGGLDPA